MKTPPKAVQRAGTLIGQCIDTNKADIKCMLINFLIRGLFWRWLVRNQYVVHVTDIV